MLMKRLLFSGQGNPVEAFDHFAGWDVTTIHVSALADQTAEYDAIFSAFALNELPYGEVPEALKNFHRLLGKDGFLLCSSPSLEWAFENIEKPERAVLEALYGTKTVPFRSGFTQKLLRQALAKSPFSPNYLTMRGKHMVYGVATKNERSPEERKAFLEALWPEAKFDLTPKESQPISPK